MNWMDGAFNKRIDSKIQLVGDEIFVTNIEILKRNQKEKIANSI